MIHTRMYTKSKFYYNDTTSQITTTRYIAHYLYYSPKFLLLEITPQMLQCAFIHSGFEFKIASDYHFLQIF